MDPETIIEEKKRPTHTWLWFLAGLTAALALLAGFPLVQSRIDRSPLQLQTGIGGAPEAMASTTPTMANTPFPSPSPAEIHDVLTVVNPATMIDLIGYRVQFHDVIVQDVLGSRVLWVGPSQNLRLLVAHDDNETIKKGQHITVTGTIERLPNSDIVMNTWKLSSTSAEMVNREPIYIRATKVSGV